MFLALHNTNQVAYEANEITKNHEALKAKCDEMCDMVVVAIQACWEEKCLNDNLKKKKKKDWSNT